MLIHFPHISPDGLDKYYESIRHILKEEPVYYAGIDQSSLCIHPMTSTSILISSNWDKKVIDWLRWVNRNICLNMGLDSEKTIMVKLRIATGMLNNIESLTDLEKIQIHSNLTDNVHRELVFIRCDGLPF